MHYYMSLNLIQTQQLLFMNFDRADASLIPRQWTIFQVNQPATHKIFQILQRCRALHSSLNKINDPLSNTFEMYDYIQHIFSNNKESVDIQPQERVIKDIKDEVIRYLKEFWDLQRTVLETFLANTQQEFQNNMLQMKQIKATQDIIQEQYLLYIKEQFIGASETYQRFAEEELKLGLQYHQASQQMPVDTENYWSIISKTKTLSQDLKGFFRDVKNQREKLASSQSSLMGPCVILFAVFLIGLVLLGLSLASFEIYGDNNKIQELAYMWQGSGVFLLYLWIDYGLSQYCFARRINVLLGMGCDNYHSIIFYRQRYKPVILLALANTYLFLFLLFLNWSQNMYIGATINILLVAYQLFQFTVGYCRIGMKQTLSFKLSCLHFNLILIPLSDIIASILALLLSPQHKNIVLIGSIYIIAIAFIFLLRLVKIANRDQSSIYERSFLLSVPLVVQIVALVYKDIVPLAIVDIIIKEVTIIFIVSYEFSLFSKKFLFQECAKTFKSIFCGSENDKSQLFLRRIQEESSYLRMIKLILILSSICLPFILPFAIYVQLFTGIHKYKYQAFIIFQYFLWQMLYINEINLRLKHPLSCSIKLSQSIALIASKPFKEDLFVDLLRNNPLEADPVFNRDGKIAAAQEYLTPQKIKKISKDLRQIQEKSRQNFLWEMVQQQTLPK